jgi:hypothetical protein
MSKVSVLKNVQWLRIGSVRKWFMIFLAYVTLDDYIWSTLNLGSASLLTRAMSCFALDAAY